MVEILDQNDLLSLSDAAHRCPGHVSQSAVWRWARKGLKARSGNRVRLRHLRVGGRLYTTQANLDGFFADLASADIAHFERGDNGPVEPAGPRPRSPNRREREIGAADARLSSRGA